MLKNTRLNIFIQFSFIETRTDTYGWYYRWDKQVEPVAATFKFSLLNSASEKSFVVDVSEKKMFGHSGGNSKSLGAPKFVSRDDLLSSSWGLLNDDTLTVICELKVFLHPDSSENNR